MTQSADPGLSILVTGAGGFIGRDVVKVLLKRHHHLRAMVRTEQQARAFEIGPNLDVVTADILNAEALAASLTGVDTVVHLAGVVSGNGSQMHEVMVEGTRKLILAMHSARSRHLILASSLSVYDWSRAHDTLNELSPLAGPQAELQGVYSAAKSQQESLARSLCAHYGIHLTVLRPGAVWDTQHTDTADLGPRLGPVQVVVAPQRLLRLVYVEQVAEAFADACSASLPDGTTINLVDSHPVTAWRFARLMRDRSCGPRLILPLPYAVLQWLARSSFALCRLLGFERHLPGIFRPRQVAARFKSIHMDTRQWREKLPPSARYPIEAIFSKAQERLGTLSAGASRPETDHG